MSKQGSNYGDTRIGFAPLTARGGIYVDVRNVTNPEEEPVPPTKVETTTGMLRTLIAGHEKGQVRRIGLYAVVAVGLALAVSVWVAIPSVIALVLLLATDRDV